MAAGLVCLWLFPLVFGLAVARSGGAGESCCRSKKTCCCRRSDGKTAWKAVEKCRRACAGASASNAPRSTTPDSRLALERPVAAGRVCCSGVVVRRPALHREYSGRAPPLV
jgi:hypothetical protein